MIPQTRIFPVDAVFTTYVAALVFQKAYPHSGTLTQVLRMWTETVDGDNPLTGDEVFDRAIAWARTDGWDSAAWGPEHVYAVVMKDAKWVVNKDVKKGSK